MPQQIQYCMNMIDYSKLPVPAQVAGYLNVELRHYDSLAPGVGGAYMSLQLHRSLSPDIQSTHAQDSNYSKSEWLTKSPPLDLTVAVDLSAMLSVRLISFPPFLGSRIQLVTACTLSCTLPGLARLTLCAGSLNAGLNVMVDMIAMIYWLGMPEIYSLGVVWIACARQPVKILSRLWPNWAWLAIICKVFQLLNLPNLCNESLLLSVIRAWRIYPPSLPSASLSILSDSPFFQECRVSCHLYADNNQQSSGQNSSARILELALPASCTRLATVQHALAITWLLLWLHLT